jgi:superfamily II DNA or RNA helicase
MAKSVSLETTVAKALENFGATVASIGTRYFQEGKVKSLKETGRDGTFEADVVGEKKGARYQVELAFEKGRYNLLCTCPIGTECSHAYAALLYLSKRFDKEILASKKGENKRRGFFPFVTNPSGLSEMETDFVDRLEDLYQTHQENRTINGRVLRGHFPKWPEKDYWDDIEIAPRIKLTRLQFWHFLVTQLEKRKLVVPGCFGKFNDASDSKELIQKWNADRLAQDWIERYQHQQEEVIQELEAVLRWKVADDMVALEVKAVGAHTFHPISPKELQQMLSDGRTGRVEMPFEVTVILALHAMVDAFQPPCQFRINPGLARRLNGLLWNIEFRKWFCDRDGVPLRIEPAHWRAEQGDGLVRFELVHEGLQGRPLLYLPGLKPLYLAANLLLEAASPPFPIEGIDCRSCVEIPRAAVESEAGIQRLIDGEHPLIPSLEKKVKRVVLKPRITVNLERGNESSTGKTIKLDVHFSDPQNGKSVIDLAPPPWKGRTQAVVSNSRDRFVIYELVCSQMPVLYEALSELGCKYDDGSWRVTKSSAKAVEALRKWIHRLPLDVDCVLPKELSGLITPPEEVDLEFEYEDAGNDWFDLKLSWNDSNLALTLEEIAAVIAARGEAVEFAERAYRSVKIRGAAELLKTLDDLGIQLNHLLEGSERLHLIHLGALLEAGLIPKSRREEFEKRLARIATVVDADIPETIQATLRPYQKVGFQFLAYLSENRFGGMLADDMGLGKTLQALSWFAWIHATYPVKGPCLVVCPKSVVDNWLSEFGRFYPSASVEALDKQGWNRANLAPGKIVVINYTQLRLLKEEVSKIVWDAIIFDEGQYLKNVGSQTTQVARGLKGKHKIMLTGTPIENRLLDLWSLMQCVMPGVLGTEGSFKSRFQEAGDLESRVRLARRVRPFILRRTKEEVALELPPKIEEDIRVSMEEMQEALYQGELKLARQRLLDIQTDKDLHQQRVHLLTSLLRLRQICCDPALVNPEHATPGVKLDALMDLLEPLVEEGNKILVFSQFVKMLNLIERRIEKERWTTFKLTGESQNRGEIVNQFNRHEGGGVFLISLRAGGSGLNLMAAPYVVLFDPWWNPAVENQAIDRAHRIGQTKTVFAYRLLVQNTIEDKIRKMQLRKSKLTKDVFGEDGFGGALTLDDFRYLLN